MSTSIVVLAIGLLATALILRYVFPEQLVAMLLHGLRRFTGLRSRHVDVDGVSWPYLDGGTESGEVMLLLHGFGGDKDNWPLYARHLRRNYRVIAPDLPGFGENTKDPDADHSVAAQVPRLRRFVEALSIDRFHIVGNSMGGFLALEYTLAYPSSVITMTLLDNAGVTGPNKSEAWQAAARGKNPLVVSSLEEFEELLDFVAHKRIPVPRVVTQHAGKKLIAQRDFLDPIFWTIFEETEKRPVDDRLHEIAVPTLIIWGRHDRVLDVSCTDLMIDRIPINQCTIFEDIGHVPMLECPAETASVQRDFINRHRAA